MVEVAKPKFWILVIDTGRRASPWHRGFQRIIALTEYEARAKFQPRSFGADGEPLEWLIDVLPYRPENKSHWLAEPRS